MSEIAQAVNAGEPLDVLLTRVSEQACALIGFEYCAVMLADGSDERLEVAGSSGLTAGYVTLISEAGSLMTRPPGPQLDTPAARAYRDGRTVVVSDVGGVTGYGRLRHLAPAQGYRALMAAPLGSAAERAGVVVGYSVTAREFGPAERELLELLADQAALALQTAQLRARQQAAISELSLANQELRRGRVAMEWAEKQHRRLMELVLADVGLADIVASLAEILGASVTVEDAEGGLLARAPEHGYRAPPDVVARRRPPTRTALEAQTRSYEVVRVPATPAGRAGSGAIGCASWVAPVVLAGDLAGRLWVTDPRTAPEPLQQRVIERFALVVGLELLKCRHVVDVEARLSGDLIGDLMRSEGPQHRPGVMDRAAALGIDLDTPNVLAVLVADPPEGVARWPELVRGAVEPGARALVGRYDDVQVLLLPAEPDPHPRLQRVLRQVQQSVGERAVVTLVEGPEATRPGEYAAAYRIAAGAARLRRAHRSGGFVDVRDLGLSALLLEAGTPEALRRFADRLLEPVVAHEARRGGDLLATLRKWFATGCAAPDAAAALVIHPNTVTYRLTRIEQLTGRSLRRPDARLELQLALTVRDIVQLDDL
ncbi:helix-turn-helix domain-containing protein [Pseudonocardia sp. MH-G8]|uniref:helix-turn-helix domain-containing protein n=1 Tax=Pseudonocardia sp. MH-G8 TaxID=1854588 RepID=UPI00130476B9|nr:helix-turn-helix domain-containing protein [Pseudonocardia sp. MH-G8]